MTINNPEYATKATATRAAKRMELVNFRIDPTEDGKVLLVDLDRPLYNNAIREKSKVTGAVGIVWDICKDMMPAASRKDIIAACIEAGVAANTARTQYQAYRKACGMVKA